MSHTFRKAVAAAATAATVSATFAMSTTGAAVAVPSETSPSPFTTVQYPLPFDALDLSPASGTEAWVVGRVTGTTSSPVQVARVSNGTLSTFSLPVTGRSPRVVATNNAAYILPNATSSRDEGEPITEQLWRWNSTSWVKTNIPNSVTVDGRVLGIGSIAGSPRAGLYATFVSTYRSMTTFDLATEIRVGRWNGSAWVLSEKDVCDMGWPTMLYVWLYAAPDGWLALCTGLDDYGIFDSSGQGIHDVVAPSGVFAASSASRVWHFGLYYAYWLGTYINSCTSYIDGGGQRCAESPESILAATMTTTGQIYLAGVNHYYRYYPASETYMRVADRLGGRVEMAAAPYSNVVWVVDGGQILRVS